MRRMPCWLLMPVLLAACGPTADVVQEPRPVPGSFFRIAIDVDENGFVDPAPAYRRANEICEERGSAAVYFQGEDLGNDQRILYFRCR